MHCTLKLVLIGFCVCFPGALAARADAPQTSTNLPRVFEADPHVLADAKAGLAAGHSSLRPALDKLLSEADHALKMKAPSVMDKRRIPPSGDKHDYMSQAPYYWRDTDSPDSPYVRRDGEHNPEVDVDFDAKGLAHVCSSAQTLGLAWYFSGDEKYAAKATEILRVWFLEPASKMNPNLNFGQGIPDEVDGRPSGLIAARGLLDVVDAVGLLARSKSWTVADQQGMVDWMTQYFQWLTTSKIGLGEAHAKNNHGSFYDTQAAAIGLFIGKTDFARKVIEDARSVRIARQIEPDGRQPLELVRTKSFHYSLFNLRALIDLASIGRNVGVDLWHYTTPDGRSIPQALGFMAVYANPDKKWPYKQIQEPRRADLGELLLRAAPECQDASLSSALKFFPADEFTASRTRLLFKTALN
ncbi:MAG TPA: alginate lyase family protein [Verrucomicrobiae bacterium]|nr:alginate lyase family protein [Verrucomicrobiae bacterium]